VDRDRATDRTATAVGVSRKTLERVERMPTRRCSDSCAAAAIAATMAPMNIVLLDLLPALESTTAVLAASPAWLEAQVRAHEQELQGLLQNPLSPRLKAGAWCMGW